MTCDRYWRDGLALFERGEPDPHRATCLDCSRAHEARHQLVSALREVGVEAPSDPGWKLAVWRQIAREQPRRWQWLAWLFAAPALAAVAIVAWRLIDHGDGAGIGDSNGARPAAVATGVAGPLVATPSGQDRPRIEIVAGRVAMRSTSAHVGDQVRISVRPGEEVRVYRAEQLVLRCTGAPAAGCQRDAAGVVAEALLATAGEYKLIVISAATALPVGDYDSDLGAVVQAGGEYKLTELSVR
jgi:hypothetical protein